MRPEIVDYDQGWPAEFEAIACRLREALGPLALRIDHIGSTSVPGLCAKDVIDVQVTVAELHDPVLTPRMTGAGLRARPAITGDHVPPGASDHPDEWRKLYFDAPESRIHIHVRRDGAANQRYAILFRDYLRAHPDAAAAYGQLKRRLAAVCSDTASYADAKDPVCDLIMHAAEVWAVGTGWQPPAN